MRSDSRNSLNLRLTLMIVLGSFTLSACGIKGGLKTPPPLWGGDKPIAMETSEEDDSVLNENTLENSGDNDLYGDAIDDPFDENPN